MLSDNLLQGKIAVLKKLERTCFESRQRFQFYTYLAAVLEFYASLRQSKEAKKSAGRIAKLFGLQERKGAHPIRVIIDATSSADAKSKSRWTRALRFAWQQRGRWTDLQNFLQVNGGPAGCAEQFAALHPKVPRSCVRVGGEDRVPLQRIPVILKHSLHA